MLVGQPGWVRVLHARILEKNTLLCFGGLARVFPDQKTACQSKEPSCMKGLEKSAAYVR